MDMTEVTQETLDLVKKSTEGVLVSTGIQGVDLSGLTSLVPVNVPARNNTSAFPRVTAGEGSQTAVWRALLNINNQQTDAAVGMDYAGTMTKFEEIDCFAPYRPLAKAFRVTLDAIAVARNYADAAATAQLQCLNSLFISQDMHIINSQGWSLGKTANFAKPTLTDNALKGEIVKTKKVTVTYAARSGANYFTGGSTEKSEQESLEHATTETGSISASWPAVKGAVAYDVFVGEEGKEQYYYTTVTTASVLITKIPVAAEALPSLPLLSAVAPSKTVALLAARVVKDTSFSTNWYNGVLASTLGDYGAAGPVRPSTGTASNAVYVDAGGAKITASGSSIAILDQVNAELWDSVQLSPSAYMVNSQQAEEISKLLLESNTAVTYLPATDGSARTNLAGGGYVAQYVNKSAGGTVVNIEVHPRVAPGTIIARTDRVPFPGSAIGNVFEVRNQFDTVLFQYAANYNPGNIGGGPRQDGEVRSMETLINRAPVAQGVISNIG